MAAIQLEMTGLPGHKAAAGAHNRLVLRQFTHMPAVAAAAAAAAGQPASGRSQPALCSPTSVGNSSDSIIRSSLLCRCCAGGSMSTDCSGLQLPCSAMQMHVHLQKAHASTRVASGAPLWLLRTVFVAVLWQSVQREDMHAQSIPLVT